MISRNIVLKDLEQTLSPDEMQATTGGQSDSVILLSTYVLPVPREDAVTSVQTFGFHDDGSLKLMPTPVVKVLPKAVAAPINPMAVGHIPYIRN